MRHHRSLRGALTLAVLLLAALACNMPGANNGVGEADSTATALALTGGPVQTLVGGGTPVSTSQVGSTPTNPPANSTATNTSAPQQCIVTIETAALNVRRGPSIYHEILRVLGEGATAVVTGRNNDSSWWQIEGQGWVSAAYVETSGNCSGIAVASFPPAPPTLTPSRTPTATATSTLTPTVITPTVTNTPSTPTLPPAASFNYTFSYVSMWSCGLEVYATFQVNNTGTVPLEWARLRVEGPPGTQLSQRNDNTPFKATATQPVTSCATPGAESLAASSSAYVYVSLGLLGVAEDTAGVATFRFCSQNNEGGTCLDKIINFTW